jgi:hypothetical protein
MSFILLNPGSIKAMLHEASWKAILDTSPCYRKNSPEKCEDGSHSTLPAMSLHSVLLEDKKCKKWNERAMGHAYNETLLGGIRIIRNPE